MTFLIPSLFESTFDYVNIRTLLLASLVFLLLSWMVRTYRTPNRGLPPGPLNLPVLGCLPFFLRAFFRGHGLFDILQTLHRQYGPVCFFPLPFGTGFVVISGYKAVHDASANGDFNQRPPTYAIKGNFHEVLRGNGEIT